jgi:hypothetical protein
LSRPQLQFCIPEGCFWCAHAKKRRFLKEGRRGKKTAKMAKMMKVQKGASVPKKTSPAAKAKEYSQGRTHESGNVPCKGRGGPQGCPPESAQKHEKAPPKSSSSPPANTRSSSVRRSGRVPKPKKLE